MCVHLAVDTVDDLEELEGPVWHGQRPVRMKKQRQRARESEAKGQKVREVEGEVEEGSLSGKKYALLAAK